MLFRRKEMQSDICFVEVSLNALDETNFLISDGNAASAKTQFFNTAQELQFLPWPVLRADFWSDFDEGKRKACSEILIPSRVAPKFIRVIHCFSSAQTTALAQKGIKSVISLDKYFR